MGNQATDVGGREYKRLPFVVKSIDADQGVVDAFVALTGNVDFTGDIIVPGAFKKTLRERGTKIKVLDSHRDESCTDAVGVPIVVTEVGRNALPDDLVREHPDVQGGLFASIQFLLNTQAGSEIFKRIQAGAIDAYSIGYDPIIAEPGTVDVGGKAQKVRKLREVRLWEISPCVWGANPATRTMNVKREGAPSEEKPWDIFEEEGQYCVYRIDVDGNRQGQAMECYPDEDDATAYLQALYANEEGSAAKQSEDEMEYKILSSARTPAYDGTESSSWSAPSMEQCISGYYKNTGADRPDEDVSSVADMPEAMKNWVAGLSLLGDGDAEDFRDLLFFPVVNPSTNSLNENALRAVLGGRGAQADIPESARESAGNKARSLLKAEFDMGGEEEDDLEGSDETKQAGTEPAEGAEPAPGEGKTLPLSLTQRIQNVQAAFHNQFFSDELATTGEVGAWVAEVYDDRVVVSEERDAGVGHFSVAYQADDEGGIVFSDRDQWVPGSFQFVAEGADEEPEVSSAAIVTLATLLADAGLVLKPAETPEITEEQVALVFQQAVNKSYSHYVTAMGKPEEKLTDFERATARAVAVQSIAARYEKMRQAAERSAQPPPAVATETAENYEDLGLELLGLELDLLEE